MPKKKKVEKPKPEETKIPPEVLDAQAPPITVIEPEEPKAAPTDEELTETVKAEVFDEEPEIRIVKPTDMVKVKVVFGTVVIAQEQYNVGDFFTVTRARAETIDPKFVEILE